MRKNKCAGKNTFFHMALAEPAPDFFAHAATACIELKTTTGNAVAMRITLTSICQVLQGGKGK